MKGSQFHFTGTPEMSPNCWQVIEEAVRARPRCNYLEWGSGNSTIAILRLALGVPELNGMTISSVETHLPYARAMVAALTDIFRAASVDGDVRVESLQFPKPSLLDCVRRDPAIARYEAHALKALWYTRNDRYWIPAAHPSASHAGRLGGVRRFGIGLQGAAAYRWEKLRRALQTEPNPLVPSRAQAIQSAEQLALDGPTRVVFDCERVRLEYLIVPPLQNSLSPEGITLDGLYQELSDYVSIPLNGPFGVALVDGYARTSCLKRIHHDRLVAPGGVLFLHDAQRPVYIEALQMFRPWSYVRGSEVPSERTDANRSAADAAVPEPPRVRSGESLRELETVLDRELFFFENTA